MQRHRPQQKPHTPQHQASRILVDQELTLDTSLHQVNTLLQTGISCITYLRGLFPDNAFEDHKLVAPRPPPAPTNSSQQQSEAAKVKEWEKETSTVRVKRLVRDQESEANRLMDYLEVGAAEAIKKGYLHQLVLAIYLDPAEPTNIVEAYTFTFTYETDAMGNKHPELVVRDQFKGMVISSTGTSSSTSSSKKRVLKEGEAKRQVQSMIKNLITHTQVLDELPRRRFLSVRLFYTPETPEDYEPPHFHPVEAESSEYRIMTRQIDEPPEVGTLGSMSTGWHGVTVHTVTISHHLETPYDDHIPSAECLVRNQTEAATRHVVWDAEKLVEAVTDEDSKVVDVAPMGVRDQEGLVRGLAEVERLAEEEEEREGEGEGEEKWRDLRSMVGLVEDEERVIVLAKGEQVRPVQLEGEDDNAALRRALAELNPSPPSTQVPQTQDMPVVSRKQSYRPPVPLFDEPPAAYAQRTASMAQEGTQLQTVDEDQEMMDGEGFAQRQHMYQEQGMVFEDVPETQLIMDSDSPPIPRRRSHSEPTVTAPHAKVTTRAQSVREQEPVNKVPTPPPPPPPPAAAAKPQPEKKQQKQVEEVEEEEDDNVLPEACECGDKECDGMMVECTSCANYKHCICYGYEETEPVADEFLCYPCRAKLHIDDSEALLDPARTARVEAALNDMRTLALYRRILQIVWDEGKLLDATELSERLGAEASTVQQLTKRLRTEKFIEERKGKGKGAKKLQLVACKTPKQALVKRNKYFTPGGGAEEALASVIDAVAEEIQQDSQSTARHGAKSTTKQGKQVARGGITTSEEQETVDSFASTTQANGGRTAKRVATVDEDPIVEDSPPVPAAAAKSSNQKSQESTLEDSLPAIVAPEQAAAALREYERRRRLAAEQQQQQQQQQQQLAASAQKQSGPLYVPDFSKGRNKDKATASAASDPFHRASSVKIRPGSTIAASVAPMDVDSDSQPEPDTIYETLVGPPPRQALSPVTRLSPKKKRPSFTMADADGEEEQEEAEETPVEAASNKRKKCSEAEAFEV